MATSTTDGGALDLDRCRRGMAQLQIEGVPRAALIEEAIAAIQADPMVPRLRQVYFGIKNYAGFGDQREDHQYGYGPKHGSIVFRIGLADEVRNPPKPMDVDAIYYLEAYRDFGFIDWQNDNPGAASYERTARMTLSHAIVTWDRLTRRRNELADAFAKVLVQAHVAALEKVSLSRDDED